MSVRTAILYVLLAVAMVGTALSETSMGTVIGVISVAYTAGITALSVDDDRRRP